MHHDSVTHHSPLYPWIISAKEFGSRENATVGVQRTTQVRELLDWPIRPVSGIAGFCSLSASIYIVRDRMICIYTLLLKWGKAGLVDHTKSLVYFGCIAARLACTLCAYESTIYSVESDVR